MALVEKVKDIFKKDEYKIFNDSLHGNIQIHPLCVKLIDTPEFQRLRQIKHLGAVDYVYPGAVHTRFEHSIGTCYLADKWTDTLVTSLNPEERIYISDQDILCVMVAGLCHDLGQGPFSNTFELYIEHKKAATGKTLEERSDLMFDHMLEVNNLRPLMEDEYGLTNSHIIDIKRMMKGNADTKDQRRMFLFEIVKNKRTGVDADTWESLARDCLHLNITNPFDYKRVMTFSRVLADTDSCTKICYRDKEIENIYKMFEMRYDLIRQAYSHRVTYVVNLMIIDVLKEANGHLSIPGTNETKTSLADCVDDMVAFTKLTDNILYHIALSPDEHGYFKKAKEIITNIAKRNLYPSYRTSPVGPVSETNLRRRINERDAMERIRLIAIKEDDSLFKENELIVDFLRLSYFKDEDDPATGINYYNKHNPTSITRDTSNEDIRLKPRGFQQYVIVVSCRDVEASSEKKKALEKALKKWFDEERLDRLNK